MSGANILNPNDYKSRGDIDEQRDRVMRYYKAAEELRKHFYNLDIRYRVELGKSTLSPTRISELVREYMREIEAKRSLSIQMYDQDMELGKAVPKALSLLKNEWGDWKFDNRRKQLRIDDRTARERFWRYQEDRNDAAAESERLRKRLQELERIP